MRLSDTVQLCIVAQLSEGTALCLSAQHRSAVLTRPWPRQTLTVGLSTFWRRGTHRVSVQELRRGGMCSTVAGLASDDVIEGPGSSLWTFNFKANAIDLNILLVAPPCVEGVVFCNKSLTCQCTS